MDFTSQDKIEAQREARLYLKAVTWRRSHVDGYFATPTARALRFSLCPIDSLIHLANLLMHARSIVLHGVYARQFLFLRVDSFLSA